MVSKLEVLKQYFGYDSFRPGQDELISTVLSGRDVLGVMPTGAGKSVCYQIPAMMLNGITLVISPLISLMKDQVNALKQTGIPAAYINSSLSMAEADEVISVAEHGLCKLLYVAPERLTVPSFLNFARDADISMVTVDEAHCVSQWGQDFRPSYLKIPGFIEGLPKRPVVSAFTATATARVREDISEMLGLTDPFVRIAGFDRPNLYFSTMRPHSRKKDLLRLVRARKDKSGIVYCSTRKNVDEVCTLLCENGVEATRYHAGLNPEERQHNQDAFLYDEKPVMVATNAFGMGINKSNVSFVIHYNMPKDMESYYQEAGRAGRDGEPAECILLYSGQDVRTANYLIENGRDAEEAGLAPEERQTLIERDRERLHKMTIYATTTDCLRGYMLKYFGEDAPVSCGHCGNCDTTFDSIDATTEAKKILSCIYRLRERRLSFGKTVVADILTGTKDEKIDKFGLETLSTYNIMPDYKPRRVRQLIDVLIENGHLECDPDRYNVLVLTPSGNTLMRRKDSRFIVSLPKEKTPAAERYSIQPHSTEADPKLYERLRALRTKLAQQKGVPPFMIFSNATLSSMASIRPINDYELMQVHGVGKAKAESYGDAFLEEIKAYILEKRDSYNPML